MMHFELSQLWLIEFSWTTSSSSALIIQINWKIKIKLKMKKQTQNLTHRTKFRYWIYVCVQWESFFVDSKWRKECWPSYLQFAIAWQTSKRFSWNSWFRWLLVSCWHHEMQSMQCFRSRSRFRSHFPYASVSVITLALNYGDKMCIIFSLKLKCSSRTHITWIRYNISTYSTYF